MWLSVFALYGAKRKGVAWQVDRTIESQRPIILLVEDNENVNAANRQLLEREGYAVRAQGFRASLPLPQKRA